MDEIILFLNQMEGYAAQRSEFWANKARQIIKAGRLANPVNVRGWLEANAGHGEFALLRNTPEDALDVELEILINLQE